MAVYKINTFINYLLTLEICSIYIKTVESKSKESNLKTCFRNVAKAIYENRHHIPLMLECSRQQDSIFSCDSDV